MNGNIPDLWGNVTRAPSPSPSFKAVRSISAPWIVSGRIVELTWPPDNPEYDFSINLTALILSFIPPAF